MTFARYMVLPWRRLLLAVTALGIYTGGFVLQARVSTLPADFDAASLAYPVLIAGVTAATPEEVRFLAEGHPVGTRLEIQPADGPRFPIVLRPVASRGYLVVTGFSGAFFWAVCVAVFLPRYHEPHVPTFLWILLLYGGAVMSGGVYFQIDPAAPGSFFGLLWLICLAALPPAFLYLTLTFPVRSSLLQRQRWIMPSLWAVAAALVTWQATAFWSYFQVPGPAAARGLAAPQYAADAVMLIVAIVGFGILIRCVRRLGGSRQGKQIRWLLWGFAVGTAPYLFLRTLPLLLGLTPPMPAGADRVLELAVPLSFVFAVVWERFLDIDIIIRRSLLYSALALVFVVMLLLPTLLLVEKAGGGLVPWLTVVPLTAGLIAGLGYGPVRDLLGRSIDRVVFGLGHDDEARLRRLGDRLDAVERKEDLAAVLMEAVRSRLDCDVCVVESLPSGAPPSRLLTRPGATVNPDATAEAFPAPWRTRGFVLAHGFRCVGDADAVVLAGPRRSGRRYVPEDLDFVVAATGLTETAWERQHLLRVVAEETEARHRMDELNRLKSEFLAQAAHDLRTPVTSVTWSVRNLLDGLAGDLEPRQREYLESVRDAAGHLDILVENLLSVSRLERAEVTAEISPFAMAPQVEIAVSSVQPIAEAGGVRLAVVEADELQVLADPEKLVVVLVNVLDNAIKYSPPGGTIDVSCRRDGTGHLVVAIRDHGPGLGQLSNPFARYAQGAPSPHTTRHGFGLGLYIVTQYVDMMGGTVCGENAAGGGALFTIRLPAADPEPEVT